MLKLNPSLKGLGVMIPGGSCRVASLLSVSVELLLFAVSNDLQADPEKSPDDTVQTHPHIISGNQNTFKP